MSVCHSSFSTSNLLSSELQNFLAGVCELDVERGWNWMNWTRIHKIILLVIYLLNYGLLCLLAQWIDWLKNFSRSYAWAKIVDNQYSPCALLSAYNDTQRRSQPSDIIADASEVTYEFTETTTSEQRAQPTGIGYCLCLRWWYRCCSFTYFNDRLLSSMQIFKSSGFSNVLEWSTMSIL